MRTVILYVDDTIDDDKFDAFKNKLDDIDGTEYVSSISSRDKIEQYILSISTTSELKPIISTASTDIGDFIYGLTIPCNDGDIETSKELTEDHINEIMESYQEKDC